MPESAADRLLKISEAATRLSMSDRQVWRLVLGGTLPSVKLGASRRVRESDLTTFIAALGNGGNASHSRAG